MYLLNTLLTINWVLSATPKIIELANLDIKIVSPDNVSTYINNAITPGNFLAPTETSDGFVSYRFTANQKGLWVVILTDGTGNQNLIYSEKKIFVTSNDIYTIKKVPGNLI